jgi:hypothetical protein
MPEQRLPPMNDYERAVVRNVEKFGWHCTSVAPSAEDDDSPCFSYTVGLFQNFGASELIIFGLGGDTAHSILDLHVQRLAEGMPIPLDSTTYDLIERYPCVYVPVPRPLYNEYVYSALWLYAEVEFPLHQIVWPNAQTKFPWHAAADAGFRRTQPVLSEPQQ